MKSNTLITEELNRIKEIMGLKIINESIGGGIVDIAVIVKKLFGVSDEVAKKLEANIESILSKTVGGTGSYDDVLNYVARQTGGVKSVDNVVDWIKTQPNLLETIATSSDKIMKQAAENVFAKSDIKFLFTKESYDYINSLLKMDLDPDFIDDTIGYFDDVLSVLNKSKGKNPNLDNLIKQLEDRKTLANNYKNVKLTSGGVASKTSKTSSELVGSTKPNIKISETQIEEIRKVLDGEVNISNYTKNLTGEEKKFIDNANNKLTQEQKDEFLETIPNKFCSTFATSALKESKINKILLKENIYDDCMNSLKKASKKGSAAGGMFQTVLVVIISMVGIAGIIWLFPRLFLGKEWGVPDYSKESGKESGYEDTTSDDEYSTEGGLD
jgi:hypothetical protein